MKTSPVAVRQLRCEYMRSPLGLDVRRPRLFWQLSDRRRGVTQTAYHVLVAASPGVLSKDQGDLWDSGKVVSGRCAHVEYGGAPLTSRLRCYYKVRVWDQDGYPSRWSAPTWWEMGLLTDAEWRAQWIGLPPENPTRSSPSPFLRKSFRIAKPVQSARLYATARGLYLAFVNGRRAGDDLFRPGWTEYGTRLQYQTCDITSALVVGENVLGAILGDGWYCGHVGWFPRNRYGAYPEFLAQWAIVFEDGTREEGGTDASWKASWGPIRASDIMMGETYDARLEMPGWAEPGFDGRRWTPVRVNPRDRVALIAQYGPGVRRTQAIAPVRQTEPCPKVYVYDLGQNIAGWARLRVRGPRGVTITVRHAEVLNPDGTLYTANLRKAKSTETYTLKGGGLETFEPHFTYHGFRYVELTGCAAPPGRNAVTGIVAHSDVERSGRFACSHRLVRRLQQNIVWSQRGNFLEVPADCPQRDERLGWTGDAQLFARTACFNYGVAAFYTRWLEDLAIGQTEEGIYPEYVPAVSRMHSYGMPGWGDAGIVIPWTVYLCYGDRRILERHYAGMRKWMAYLEARSRNGLRPWEDIWGDWLSINAVTPLDLFSTAFFAYVAALTRRIARVLGKRKDAARYAALFHRIRLAFNREFVSPNGRIAGDTQTGYVLALAFDLLSSANRRRALRYLMNDLERRGGHLSTGFVGSAYLLPTLSKMGQDAVAYALIRQETFPSWGYSIRNGATTIWEHWDGWTREKGFYEAGMNSFNHYAYGAVGQWLYQTVIGLDIDPERPGYRHAFIRPVPGPGFTRARGELRSLYGRMAVEWRVSRRDFCLRVAMPPNTTATVILPVRSAARVREGGLPLSRRAGVGAVRTLADGVACEIGSGRYEFVCAHGV